MDKNEKLLLFIVEGGSDAKALRAILDHGAFPGQDVQFIVTHGDVFKKDTKAKITFPEKTRIALLEKKIISFVCNWLNNAGSGYKTSDITEIIQIIDTDATFISEKMIIEDPSIPKENNVNVYYDDNRGCIVVKNKSYHVDLREERSELLAHFSALGKLDFSEKSTALFIPYRILYMSCNLEHAMHNVANIPKSKEGSEKFYLAGKLARRYGKDLKAFIDFVCQSDISVPGSYEETWFYIMDKEHPIRSLERHTNLGVLFNKV